MLETQHPRTVQTIEMPLPCSLARLSPPCLVGYGLGGGYKRLVDKYALLFLNFPQSKRKHYANMSVQYTAIFHGCKNGNFQMKKCDIFLIFAQNIDHGYTLEPLR